MAMRSSSVSSKSPKSFSFELFDIKNIDGVKEVFRRLVIRIDAAYKDLLNDILMNAVQSVTCEADYIIKARTSYVGVTNTSADRALSLPPLSAVEENHRLTIKDESGGAAAHNITMTANGTDTIDGAAATVISANYGVVRLMATRSGWFII